MRRKDKEVTDKSWQYAVLKRGIWMSVAMTDSEGKPYVIPMNYGFGDGFICLHGARGLKTECIEAHPDVAFSVVADGELVRNDNPAEFTMKFRSVCGKGRAHIVEDAGEKHKCLELLINHYDGPKLSLPEAALKAVTIIRIDIEEMTGKNSNYPVEEIL